jgi:cytochrome P450
MACWTPSRRSGGGDLIEDFASAIPVEIIGNLLGVPHADRGPLRGWSLAILGALEPKLTPEQEALGNQSVSDFTAYLRELVRDRRAHPGDPEHDVLTRLIQGEQRGRTAQRDRAAAKLRVHPERGHETTTNLIGNALVALQEWPDEKAGLLQRMAAAP